MSLSAVNVTNLPIYLPFNKAPVPFGDTIEGLTCTSAAPGVLNAAGYVPTNGDLVAISYLTGGSFPTGLGIGTIGQYPSFAGNASVNPVGLAAAAYYVVSANQATGNFSLSLTKGGAAITTSSTGSLLVLHLLSGQVDGLPLPFKPGNTVVVENNSGGSLTLQGAADAGQATPGNGYNPPTGPGTWNTLAVVPANSVVAGVNLAYDWIRVSTSGTLSLQQS